MKIYVQVQSIDEINCTVVARFYTDAFPQGTNFQNIEIRSDDALASEEALAQYLVLNWAPTDWLKRMGELKMRGTPNMSAVRTVIGKTLEVEWTPAEVVHTPLQMIGSED